MDIKRLVLAIALSAVIFIGYNLVAQHMGWLPQPAQQSAQSPGEPSGSPDAAPAVPAVQPGDPSMLVEAPVFTPVDGRLVTVETPLYKAVFHSSGGILRSFELKRYRVGMQEDSARVNLVSDLASGQAPMGLLLNGAPTWAGGAWSFEGGDLVLGEGETGSLRFGTEVNGLRVSREFRFSGDNYTIAERLNLSSPSDRQANISFTFGASSLATDKRPGLIARLKHTVFGGPEPAAEESQYNPTRVAWFQNGSFSEENSQSSLGKGELVQGNVSWMAVMNNYFMGAVSMADEAASAKGRFIDGVYHVLIGRTNIGITAGADTGIDCAYFLGPKEARQLESTPNNLERALDYGMFSIVAKPLVWLLNFFYNYVGNYGVAIVLMTIIIKVLLWPLSYKSYKSMQQMKQLQPLMAKLREKYAGDKEALNREIMQLYKTYKVNPAGGCLPILVQMPVFFGLYQALLNAIELRHATFIGTLPFTDIPWLIDMAAPDPLLITPLVMGASMMLQQKMTPTPGDPTQAKIMMFMPVIFTVLFLGFPSGLVVYWLVNNIISIGQQWWQLRRTTS